MLKMTNKNILFSCLLSLFTVPALAGTAGLGKQVDFVKDESGRPQFEVKTVYDSYIKGTAWFLKFSINGQDISGGANPTIISWRIWDKQSESFISDPPSWVQVLQTDDKVENKTFSVGIPRDQAREATLLGSRLAVVFFAGDKDASGAPTHFIDLGANCESYPGQFINDISGTKGCGVLQKPKMTLEMPSGNGKIKINNSLFDPYCSALNSLVEDVQKAGANLPVGLSGGIQREQKLAKAICDKKGKFSGFKEFKEPNTQAISTVAVVENGFRNLVGLESILKPNSSSVSMVFYRSYDQFKGVVYNDQLFTVYTDLMGSQSEAYDQVQAQAIDLANFYRDQ